MAVKSKLNIMNARLIFKNFSGKESDYNVRGDRNTCVVLDDDQANELLAQGWPVKVKPPREGYEDEGNFCYMKVKVKFGDNPNLHPQIYRILNDDNPEEFFEVAWPICGTQADMSQAFGSALTYANRYFYLKFFNIATSEDDPDEWKRKKNEAADAENREAAKAVIQKVDELCRANVNEQNGTEIKNIIKKYATDNGKPTANYLKIQDLEEANRLYTALVEYFNKAQA